MTPVLTDLERTVLDSWEIAAGIRIVFDDETLQASDGLVRRITAEGDVVYRWRCTVCGYVHEAPEPPKWCPLCGADREMFVRDDEAA
jgi:rubrerythrin